MVVQGGGPQEGQLRQLRATSPWRPRSHLCSEGPREATAGGRGCSRWGLSLGTRKPQMASRALHVAPALGAASSPPAPTPGFPWAPLHRSLASLPPPRDSFSTSSSTSFLKPRSLCSSVSWNARDVPEGAALPSDPSPVRVCARARVHTLLSPPPLAAAPLSFLLLRPTPGRPRPLLSLGEALLAPPPQQNQDPGFVSPAPPAGCHTRWTGRPAVTPCRQVPGQSDVRHSPPGRSPARPRARPAPRPPRPLSIQPRTCPAPRPPGPSPARPRAFLAPEAISGPCGPPLLAVHPPPLTFSSLFVPATSPLTLHLPDRPCAQVFQTPELFFTQVLPDSGLHTTQDFAQTAPSPRGLSASARGGPAPVSTRGFSHSATGSSTAN